MSSWRTVRDDRIQKKIMDSIACGSRVTAAKTSYLKETEGNDLTAHT